MTQAATCTKLADATTASAFDDSAAVRELREQLAAAHLEISRLNAALADATRRPVPARRPTSVGPEPLLRTRDVATLLRVCERTVRRWRELRVLPAALEIEGVCRWRRETIDAWLEAREGAHQ
jgi:predicted DNA-binding transcriptional regulator AlpA